MGIDNKIIKFLIFLVLMMVALLILVPILSIVNVSIKTQSEFFSAPVSIAENPVFSNFKEAWFDANMGKYFLNSVFYTVVSSVLVSITSLFVAYPIARKKVAIHNLLYLGFAISLMLPPAIIPLYSLMRNLHFINTYHGMVLFYTGSGIPLTVFVLTGFVKTIPKELDDAALIDGCGYYKFIFKIILPLLKPAISMVMMLNALSIWNDFVHPYLFLTKDYMRTLASGLYMLKGEFSMNLPVFSAAIVITAIPITIIYLLLQEQITAGLIQGSVKG